MPPLPLRSLLPLVSLYLSLHSAASTTHNLAPAPPPQDLLLSSCLHASYPNICMKTLSSYSGPSTTAHDLAQAAVKVSLERATKLSKHLSSLLSGLKSSKRYRVALSDCVEQISDAVDELSDTLSELKHLKSGDSRFGWKMSNVETWVSAALSDEDSCIDGFEEVGSDEIKVCVERKVGNVAKITSNALYMINLLN